MPTSLSDGKIRLVFPLSPETIQGSYALDFAENKVLDTKDPHIRRKALSRTHKIDRLLLVSFEGRKDFAPFIKQMSAWASNQARLKYSSPAQLIPACYIKSFGVKILSWSGAKVWHAELNLELLGAAGPIKALPVGTPAKKITPREVESRRASIEKGLKKPATQKILGVDRRASIEVGDDGLVSLNGQTPQPYEDIALALRGEQDAAI